MQPSEDLREFSDKLNKRLHYAVFAIGIIPVFILSILYDTGLISKGLMDTAIFGSIGFVFLSIALLGFYFKEVTAGGLIAKKSKNPVGFLLMLSMFLLGGLFFLAQFILKIF